MRSSKQGARDGPCYIHGRNFLSNNQGNCRTFGSHHPLKMMAHSCRVCYTHSPPMNVLKFGTLVWNVASDTQKAGVIVMKLFKETLPLRSSFLQENHKLSWKYKPFCPPFLVVPSPSHAILLSPCSLSVASPGNNKIHTSVLWIRNDNPKQNRKRVKLG